MGDLEDWLERLGEETLRKIDFNNGKTFLDFGCGSGNYTIPLAKILQDTGKIYALDQDSYALEELDQRRTQYGLKNIHRIDSSGDIEIPLEDNTVDVVLFYDIFWYFPLDDPRLDPLIVETKRILKPNGVLSVFPTHIDKTQLQEKIENFGFNYYSEFKGQLFHYSWLEKGQILNYQIK